MAAYILCHPDFDTSYIQSPKKFVDEVHEWLVDGFRKTTFDQMAASIEYLRNGYDPMSGEYPVYISDEDEKDEWDAVGGNRSWALSRYLEASAVGIPTAAALRATSPQLAAMVERAYISRGCELKDREKQLTANYFMTLDSMKKLLEQMKEVKENG